MPDQSAQTPAAVRPDDPPEALDGIDLARASLDRARADAQRRAAGAVARPATGQSVRQRPDARGQQLRSGAGPDERDPQPIGRSVDRLLQERGWQGPAAVGGLTGRWADIVGPDVAAHVVPESFELDDAQPGRPSQAGGSPQSEASSQPSERPQPTGRPRGGRLVLRADSTTWATHLRLLLPVLRERLDAELGRGVVGQVTIVGPAAPRTGGAWRVPGRGPRDTYG
ncbi:MAG: DUF721 domain-containing protein [Actinomycetota bacterium]|nr:MAG: DUF721 domain-containing protein [Actinomycetota bacterium]